jgi:hypothetical protein
MAKTKQLKVRISDEFQQLLASAWRHLPRKTGTKGIESQSDFIINAILLNITSSKLGKDFINKFGNDVEEVEWWKNKDKDAIKKNKELKDMTEQYFQDRLKK